MNFGGRDEKLCSKGAGIDNLGSMHITPRMELCNTMGKGSRVGKA